MEEKGCISLSFLAIFMKSYTIIVKILSKRMIIVILYYWVKNVVYEQLDMCLWNTDAPGGNKVKV